MEGGTAMVIWKCRISVLVFCISTIAANRCYALDPPPITPIDEFFVLGTPPAIPPDWHLVVEGVVESPLSLSLGDLMSLPATTQMSTLECYYTFGNILLIGNANWTGIPLNDIIQQAHPLNGAKSISFVALDNYVSGAFDLNDIRQRNDFLLSYGMNGQMLPLEQGYPLKLVLPGVAGFENARWLERIEISTAAPNRPLYHFPIHARITSPGDQTAIPLGNYTIRGIAYAGEGKEVSKVEVSTDGGASWQPATLLNYFAPNVWKHWKFSWRIPHTGDYILFARAIDSLGNVQREEPGNFGWRGFDINVKINYGSDCPNLDGINPVSFIDFSVFAGNWRVAKPGLAGDLNMDGVVDEKDLGIFAYYWLCDCY